MRKTVECMCQEKNREYERRTKPRKMFPLFSRSCHCCGDEIKFEPMWEVAIPYSRPFSDKQGYKYGCMKCFPKAKDFYNQLITDGYINQPAWVFGEKPLNVDLKTWAIMSGYYNKEEVMDIDDFKLLKEWVAI